MKASGHGTIEVEFDIPAGITGKVYFAGLVGENINNALQHLHQEITLTRKVGSISLEECLARLVRTGVIERGEALARAIHPDDFEHALTQA